jgi:hypothetical protein
MNGTTGALLIAVVGVLGTLSAPVVSQRLSASARREEFALQRLHRQEDFDRELQREALAAKRACYVSLTATSRRYRVELMNYLHRVNGGTAGDGPRGELEEARRGYIASLAETQMTATAPVLDAVDPVTSGLSEAYRTIMALDGGHPQPGWSFEETRDFLQEHLEDWRHLRAATRADLGVRD